MASQGDESSGKVKAICYFIILFATKPNKKDSQGDVSMTQPLNYK
jgi:hypothetical protein